MCTVDGDLKVAATGCCRGLHGLEVWYLKIVWSLVLGHWSFRRVSTVLTIPSGTHRDTHVISVPIRVCSARHARCFGLLVSTGGDDTRKQAQSYRANVATTIENLTMSEDLPTEPGAWFTAFILRVQRALEAPSKRAAPLSVVLGVSFIANGRRSIAFASSGILTVRRVARSVRGAVSCTEIAVSEDARVPLQFSSAVEGLLGANDALLIGTPALQKRLPDALVMRAWKRGSVSDALAALRAAVGTDDQPVPLLIVAGSTVQPSNQSHTSMASFLSTATATDGFLTPRLLPTLNRYVADARNTGASLLAARPRTGRQRTRPHSAQRASRGEAHRILPALTETVRLAFSTVAVAVKSAAAILFDAVRIVAIGAVRGAHTARALASRFRDMRRRAQTTAAAAPPQRSPEPSAPVAARMRAHITRVLRHGGYTHVAREILATARTRYRTLPTTSQRLLILACVFAALFAASTIALWRRQVTDADVASHNALINQMEELRSVAEARLLFGDRQEALSAFRDAEALAATLPRDSRARRERAAKIAEELGASLDRARLLTRIKRPLTVAAAGSALPFPAISTITMVGSDVIAIAGDRTQLARINPRAGTVDVQRIVPVPQLNDSIRALALDDRLILLMDDAAAAAFVDITNGQMTTASIEQPPATIRDAAVFQKRLYLLHPDGSVSRRTRTAGGFSRGEVWLRAAPDTNGFMGLFVNGAAFLASADGTITRYLAGRRSDVDLLAQVDPMPNNTVLITAPLDPDADVLFLGTPDDGRIIALHDDGRLLGQLQSNTFRGMHRIIASPDAASIFILHGNTISVVVPPK